MGGTALGIGLLLTLTAPPAQPERRPIPPDPSVTREAARVANWLNELAEKVSSVYPQDVPAHKLLSAGLAKLHARVGQKLPVSLPESLAKAATSAERVKLITTVLATLNRPDEMTMMEAFVIAANGFASVTDPASSLIWRPRDTFAVSEAEFGLGFELEGATGAHWMTYLLESAVNPGEVTRSPVTVPWVVHRVIPGSPAAKAGLRPGDRITHLEGDPITLRNNAASFHWLASVSVPSLRPPGIVQDMSKPVNLLVDRDGASEPIEAKLNRTGYVPESVFGVTRQGNGSWDFMLDRDARVGYIRLGAIEQTGLSTSSEFARALASLSENGAEALILDLRWCPGGYVTPITQIIGAFIPAGRSIATIQNHRSNPAAPRGYYAETLPGATFQNKLQLAVLVNGETVGGGEMIAAALQDQGRAIVIGQRTFGKANIMQLIDTPLPGGIGYRVSTMYCLRLNGKNRHRFPDSKPTDDWGVRPDRGFEVPMTPDLSARLHQDAERCAIRPPGSTEAIKYDDPLADPQRMMALRLLKEKLKSMKKGQDPEE